MKTLFFAITYFIFSSSLLGQSEFETYKNGLIYSEETMLKLEHIVDSLNLKCKFCDINKSYYSKQQTIGHKINLEKEDVQKAKKDIKNNISFDEFVLKYSKAEIKKNVLIVKFNYTNYKKGQVNFLGSSSTKQIIYLT